MASLDSFFLKKIINSIDLIKLLDGRKKGLIYFILIDVREIIENENEMILGTDHLIPTSNLIPGLNKVSNKKEENIIVYCHSGVRSAKVQEIMKKIGFKKVVNLIGGVSSCSEKIKN